MRTLNWNTKSTPYIKCKLTWFLLFAKTWTVKFNSKRQTKKKKTGIAYIPWIAWEKRAVQQQCSKNLNTCINFQSSSLCSYWGFLQEKRACSLLARSLGNVLPSFVLSVDYRLQVALDNPLLNNFIAALEQLSNPEMVFKVCIILTTFCLFSYQDCTVCFVFFLRWDFLKLYVRLQKEWSHQRPVLRCNWHVDPCCHGTTCVNWKHWANVNGNSVKTCKYDHHDYRIVSAPAFLRSILENS